MGEALALEKLRPLHLLTQQAAAQTTVTTARFDMQGYAGVLFLCRMGAIDATGVVEITAHSSETDADGDELEGTKITLGDTDDDSMNAIVVDQPNERYVQIQIARTVANSVIEYACCLGYKAAKLPVDLTGFVDNFTQVIRPDEV